MCLGNSNYEIKNKYKNIREQSEQNCEKESNKMREKNVRKKMKNQRNVREKAEKSEL